MFCFIFNNVQLFFTSLVVFFIFLQNLVKEFATPICTSSFMQCSECLNVFLRLKPQDAEDEVQVLLCLN